MTAPRPPRAGRRAQDPPEVTWPDPALDDGADADLRLPDPDVELELADGLELAAGLELAGLADRAGVLEPEPDVAALGALLPGLAAAAGLVLAAAEDAVAWADAALASPTAMPPPARTLAAPIVAVMARSRPWLRSRAVTAARTLSLPVSTPAGPSAGPGASSGAVRPACPPDFCVASACAPGPL